MTDTGEGQGLGYRQWAGQGQGHRPGVKDTAGHNYFRFVWDDDEEADDVPTPPQHRKDYPEPPPLPPDLIPAAPPPEMHSGIAQAPTHNHYDVPILDAPPPHPNPHRSPTGPTTTPTPIDTLTINNNIYNLSGGGGNLYDARLRDPNASQVDNLPSGRNTTSRGAVSQGEVVLGVNTIDAVFSSNSNKDMGYLHTTEAEDTHPRVTYPALEGVGGGDKGAAGMPILQYPGMRPRGSYESSGIRRPLSPLRVKPNSIVSDVETTHVSLLSDDENILAADDVEITSPFTPDHGAILSQPGRGGVNKVKRRRMIIWALIICAAMVIAGLVTYLSVRAIWGW